MPIIYHVNTVSGSDANSGSTWALAWKTFTPLKSLYTGTSISDVEIRVAKTPFTTTDFDAVYTGNAIEIPYCPYSVATGVPLTSLKVIAGRIPPLTGNVTAYGWVISGNAAGATTGTLGAWPYAGWIDVPSAASGIIVKKNLSGTGITPSNYNRIEIRLWVLQFAYTGTLTLNLCAELEGVTVLQSFPLTLHVTSAYDGIVPIVLSVGVGVLTSSLTKSVTLTTTGTTQLHTLYLSNAIFALAPTAVGYVGFNAVYLPQVSAGNVPKQVVGVRDDEGTSAVFFWGSDLFNGGKAYDVYPYYETINDPVGQVSLPSTIGTFGTPALPVAIVGGYNPDTGLVDGLTCMDAQQVQLIPGETTAIGIRASSLVLANPGKFALDRGHIFSGGAPYYSPASVDVGLTRVRMPYPYRDASAGGATLFYKNMNPQSLVCSVSIADSSIACPISRQVAQPTTFLTCSVTDSNYCSVPLAGLETYNTTVREYTTINFIDSYINVSGAGTPLVAIGCVFTRCTFYTWLTGNSFSTGILLKMYSCSFIGNRAMPVGVYNLFDAPRIEHTADSQWSFGDMLFANDNLHGCVIQNIVASTPATGGWNNGGLVYGLLGNLVIKNCVFTVNFSRLVGNTQSGSGSLEIADSTFTAYGLSGLTAIRLTPALRNDVTILNNVRFGSGYTTAVEGNTGSLLMVNITMDNPAAVVLRFLNAPNPGRAIFASRANLILDTLHTGNATPVVLPANPTYATYYPITLSVSNVIGANIPDYIRDSHTTLTKDTAVFNTTTFSWRHTVGGYSIGSPIVSEHLIGSFHVFAAVGVRASIKCKRNTQTCRGWLVIRPLFTRATNPRDLKSSSTLTPGSWEPLSLEYTPDTAGAMEVYLAVTGVAASSVWFDDFSFVQV